MYLKKILAMGRLFGIWILTSLFAIVNGHALVDELGDRQKSVESALNLMKIGLQEFSEGIERIVIKRLKGVENIVDEKIKQMIGNATRNIEDQSTDESEKISEKLLSTSETEQRQKFESPTTKVDKKISDLLFTTQIEQRLFRQEMVSVTASLFGKLDKIRDVISVTQAEQRLFNEEIKSLSTNLSERIDQKISDLITTTQTEQRHLRQKFEYFTTNLTKNVEEKIIDVLSTTHTEQQVLNKNIESLFSNISENIDNKISNKLSAIQTEQQTLKQDVFSLTANLAGKVDNIRNTSVCLAEQLFSGEAIDTLRNVEMISQYLLKVHDMAGTDCADILKKYPNTRWNNGVYNITVSPIKFKAVYCDMATDNGGWTVHYLFFLCISHFDMIRSLETYHFSNDKLIFIFFYQPDNSNRFANE